jgi:hypothetical protein
MVQELIDDMKLFSAETLFKVVLTFVLAGIFLPSTQLMAMTFNMQEICIEGLTPQCQNMVLAEGPIVKSTPAEFKEWSRNIPSNTWIALTSPGGSVIGGLQLGQAIRLGGFNTTIAGTDYSPKNCLSACAYAFLGGLIRYLPPNTKYGLHQYRGPEKEINADEAQKLNAIMGKYVDYMGVDRRVLDYAQMTSNDKMTVLSQTEAKKLRVDNFGQSLYPKWRLEVANDGKLLVLNTATIQGRLPISIAFTKMKQSIACIIYYKSNDEVAFTASTPHKIVIQNQSYSLAQISPWQEKNGGYQIIFEVPKKTLEAIESMSDESAFTINPEFFQNPTGIQGPINIWLGGLGLKNALSILSKS